MRGLLSVLAYLAVVSLHAAALQQPAAPGAPADDGQARAQDAIVGSMSGHHMHEMSAHMKLTPQWAERPGDRERANAIVAALRSALERYRDYHVAERNGYEIFHPEIPQAIYHFTNYWQGFSETFRFTPDQATSLLYRKTASAYDLVGAMYTAPAMSSELDLDARVPLSIARWHEHINICLPPRGDASKADWTKFGPDGSISTAEACTAAHGRFFPQLFGWMVHVYPFEKTAAKIWAVQ
ncbi:MAG: hypothetical protein DMF87_25455 [Acidobacteria bacterium]|nr:MAG: hypothetical protein DMF87_25455 [Acidobacteriota bacterium]